jgi:hypothetical protein
MDHQQNLVNIEASLSAVGHDGGPHRIVEVPLSSSNVSTSNASLESGSEDLQAVIDAHYRVRPFLSSPLYAHRTDQNFSVTQEQGSRLCKRCRNRKALLSSSEESGLRPAALNFEGVQIVSAQPVVMTPDSNIFNGIHIATAVAVCLKTRRRLRGSSVQDVRKVSARQQRLPTIRNS